MDEIKQAIDATHIKSGTGIARVFGMDALRNEQTEIIRKRMMTVNELEIVAGCSIEKLIEMIKAGFINPDQGTYEAWRISKKLEITTTGELQEILKKRLGE